MATPEQFEALQSFMNNTTKQNEEIIKLLKEMSISLKSNGGPNRNILDFFNMARPDANDDDNEDDDDDEEEDDDDEDDADGEEDDAEGEVEDDEEGDNNKDCLDN